MAYPNTRKRLNPFLLATLTFQLLSTTLEVRTQLASNAQGTSKILILPYPTTRKQFNPLLLATLTFQLGSVSLELHMNFAFNTTTITPISSAALLHTSRVLKPMVLHLCAWPLPRKQPYSPQSMTSLNALSTFLFSLACFQRLLG